MVRPLRDLVMADKYEWKQEHTDAFKQLKGMIGERVVLAHPYPNKSFVLECDASDYGLGYILSQEDKRGKLRVVAFGSRSLSSTERNYFATECECLAVVDGIKKYHVYLHGNPFTVYTDHKALTWLMNSKDHTSKLMRWALQLQEYQFVIKHRKGKANANTDALSRLVEAEPRATSIQHAVEVVEAPGKEEDDIKTLQWRDKILKPIIKYLKDGELPKDDKKAKNVVLNAQHMELDDGVLYHIWWPQNKRYWNETRRQLAVPEVWRIKALQECHDSSLTGGHLGFTKTHLKIQERY